MDMRRIQTDQSLVEGDTMEHSEIVKALYTKRELERNLHKSCYRLHESLERKDFSVAAFYSLDVAHIYQFLGEIGKAQSHYEKTLEYVGQSKYQWYDIREKCLIALGRIEEVREIVLNDPHITKRGLAGLYEKIGDYDLAQELYEELAQEHSKKADESTFFQPQKLQYASDLWEKARKTNETRTYNQKAVKAWQRISSIKKSLASIEEAWLCEEVGYIYQKADNLKTAMNYYQKAWAHYRKAYTEDITATGAHQVDGDWDYYVEWFSMQIPGNVVLTFRSEHPMKYDQRRMKYRKLSLKENCIDSGSF
jgi:tetratricopeptide (TPR) repeat protein